MTDRVVTSLDNLHAALIACRQNIESCEALVSRLELISYPQLREVEEPIAVYNRYIVLLIDRFARDEDKERLLLSFGLHPNYPIEVYPKRKQMRAQYSIDQGLVSGYTKYTDMDESKIESEDKKRRNEEKDLIRSLAGAIYNHLEKNECRPLGLWGEAKEKTAEIIIPVREQVREIVRSMDVRVIALQGPRFAIRTRAVNPAPPRHEAQDDDISEYDAEPVEDGGEAFVEEPGDWEDVDEDSPVTDDDEDYEEQELEETQIEDHRIILDNIPLITVVLCGIILVATVAGIILNHVVKSSDSNGIVDTSLVATAAPEEVNTEAAEPLLTVDDVKERVTNDPVFGYMVAVGMRDITTDIYSDATRTIADNNPWILEFINRTEEAFETQGGEAAKGFEIWLTQDSLDDRKPTLEYQQYASRLRGILSRLTPDYWTCRSLRNWEIVYSDTNPNGKVVENDEQVVAQWLGMSYVRADDSVEYKIGFSTYDMRMAWIEVGGESAPIQLNDRYIEY